MARRPFVPPNKFPEQNICIEIENLLIKKT